MSKLRAVYHPRFEPKVTASIQEIGTFWISMESGEVMIRVRTPASHAHHGGFYVSIDMHYDGVDIMRELDQRGFLSRFKAIKASTFYDVLQCLNVAGIPLVSHDHDSLEYTSRAMYELLNEPQEKTT
jgi:hypothetical protein